MDPILAPAKINLWLNIFSPDATGYHPLDTLFCAIQLSDELSLETTKTPGIALDVLGADVGPHDKNLAHRAALEYFTATGIPPRVRIVLQKNIPAGAGLGGGSSDAAATLLALNELHGNVLSIDDLMSMGARLGSDVPFFLCGSALAHATGRGEVLRGLPALPAAPALIVMPGFAVATADAYRWIDEARAFAQPRAREENGARDWDDVARKAVNTFEAVVFAKHPQLARMKQGIASTGARIALLSGSGSALFGIYDTEAERDAAAQTLRQYDREAVVIETATRA